MRKLFLVALGIAALGPPAQAFELKDCWQTKDPHREIAACTHFIDSGTLNADQLPKAHTGRGVGLAKLGRTEEAIAEHTKAILLAPNYPLPLVNRGSAYSASGNFVRAIADFDAALRLDPGNAGALNNRAWAQMKLGHPGKGLSDAERAASILPQSAAVQDTLGAILEALGRREEAIEAFRRALERDAGLESARDALRRLGAE